MKTFRWRRLGGGLALVSLLLLGLWLLCPKPDLYGGTGFSTALYDREGGLLRLTLAPDDRYRLRTPLAQIAPAAVKATLLYEDAYFYRHIGVNPVSLVRAGVTTYLTGERAMGASTLSMQLARLRFSLDTRSLSGKAVQILRALQLERHYSKNALLQAYFNLAPYGGNIEGIGTASRIYFGKSAAHLTVLEALTLAVIPQDPNGRSPNAHGEPPALIAARQRAFAIWQRTHPEDADLATRAASPLAMSHRGALPFRAPHFVDRVLAQTALAGTQVHTTLSPSLQHLAEKTVSAYVTERRESGLNNAAVLIMDTRDSSVSALVGSADWHDDAIQGQVNGTAARRSPGSALKPFIYALALDQGLIHPMTLLEDAPARYGAYTPENFDQGFMGPVFAQDALIYSRNLPAVSLAAQLQPDFHSFLLNAGIGAMQPAAHYGLAIALGGIEVTMEEVVQLYGALANNGVQQTLAFVKAEAGSRPGQPLLSPEASFITRDMLARNPRPNRIEMLRDRDPHIPWKTGTSYAFRDAWAVGLVGPYAVAVWVGNFDGTGNPAFVGQSAAAPLLFRLVDGLRRQGVAPDEHPPNPEGLNLRRVPVCAATGDLPNRYCPRSEPAWFIPGVSPIKVSDVYRPVRIDPTTGLRACPNHAGPTQVEVYEFWPSNLLRLYSAAGLPRRVPPPFNPGCSLTTVAGTGMAPGIQSPQSTVVYHLRPNRLSEERIPLQARADADARTLYWFVDGHFLGRSDPGETLFWQPHPGEFAVRVVDDLGRASSVTVRVALLPQTY